MSGSGISWTICKSAPRSRQITTPAPHHCFYRLDALPATQPTASKHWKPYKAILQQAKVQSAYCSHSCCMVPQWYSGTANHSQSPGPILMLTAQKQLFSWWPTSSKLTNYWLDDGNYVMIKNGEKKKTRSQRQAGERMPPHRYTLMSMSIVDLLYTVHYRKSL